MFVDPSDPGVPAGLQRRPAAEPCAGVSVRTPPIHPIVAVRASWRYKAPAFVSFVSIVVIQRREGQPTAE